MRVFISAVVLLCIIFCGFIPSIVYNKLPVYEFIRPQETEYTPSIRANGMLEMSEYREVYLQTPVIPEKVYVTPGDFVSSGELLATIDQKKTIETVKTTQIPISDKDITKKDEISDQLSSIANLFGVDASLVTSLIGEYSVPQEVQISQPVEPVAEIFAPISGIVTEVNLKADNVSGINKPAVTIGDRQSYIARVSVKESDLPYINEGQTARISGVGLGGRNYLAYVKKISPTAKKQVSGTNSETIVEVDLKICYPDSHLMPGLSTKAEIHTGAKRDVIIIPYETVHQDNLNREYVYIYTENGIKKVYIETGAELYEGVEVNKGINVNDIVIVTSDELKEKSQAVLKEAA